MEINAVSPVYMPGLAISALARDLQIDVRDIIKLASNEAPLGPSKQAMLAANQTLSKGHIYPESSAFALREAVSAHLNVAPNQLTFGPGSESVISLIAQAYLRPGDDVVVSEYAFIAYEMATFANQAKLVKVPANLLAHDLPAMAAHCSEKTRIVFLANPNNPTGTWFTEQDLLHFLASIPSHILVVLDEAYVEFMADAPFYPQSLRLLPKFPNLIITRTFSKAYALAGLRVGYAVSHPDVADFLNRIRMPFNVSEPAIAAAVASLADGTHLTNVKRVVALGKKQLEQSFDALGFSYMPASVNFFLVRFGLLAKPVYQYLLQQHIIVRPVDNYGLSDYLRITVGLTEENAKLLEALGTFIGHYHV